LSPERQPISAYGSSAIGGEGRRVVDKTNIYIGSFAYRSLVRRENYFSLSMNFSTVIVFSIFSSFMSKSAVVIDVIPAQNISIGGPYGVVYRKAATMYVGVRELLVFS